ncbi:MAG: SxtJ family membrane protein [Rhodospirillales bacterium]
MTKTRAFHEDFGRGDGPKAGSERGFGTVFAMVFAVIGFWPLLDGEAARIWALVAAALFLAAGLLAPRVLKPLNRLWFLFGMAFGRVVNPLVMGLLFCGTITPIALVMRLAGKDPLRLRFEPDAKSYWIERHPAGPAPESMRNQF